MFTREKLINNTRKGVQWILCMIWVQKYRRERLLQVKVSRKSSGKGWRNRHDPWDWMESKQAGDVVWVWAAVTKYTDYMACKEHKFISCISENWPSEIRAPVPADSVRAPFWVVDCQLPVVFSRGQESSWPRDRTSVSCTAGRFFTIWSTREAVTKVADPRDRFCSSFS